MAALGTVGGLATQIEQAGLLLGAVESGFLWRCGEPISTAELARESRLGAGVVEVLCDTLRSMGVLRDAAEGRVVVSPRFAPLRKGGVDQRVPARLNAATVRAQIFRGLFAEEPSSYWTLSSQQRLALAMNAGADVRTEWARELVASSIRAIPEWHEKLSAGARTLDMGCGIGTRICGSLWAYPKISAVGVDLADDLLEVARARAHDLAVADRADFFVADAARYRDADGFDVIWWPQTFFSQSTWHDALASAFANLRPGGLLVTVDPPRPPSDAPANSLVPVMLERLLQSSWDVFAVTGEELRSELEHAGFVSIAAAPPVPGVLPYLTAQRPS
jgi:SAM-dependent methyltransferase